MIFVLDNYDSFTYNLVQYIGELGAEVDVADQVEVRRNDQVTVSEVESMHPEKIVISPAPARRTRRASALISFATSLAKFRSSESAWDTRRSAKPSADAWCAPLISCTVRPARSCTTIGPSFRVSPCR